MKRLKLTPKPSSITIDDPNGYTKSNHQPHHQWPYNPTSITAQASHTTAAKNPNPSTYKCIENPNPNSQQTQTQESLDRRPNITKLRNSGERYEPIWQRGGERERTIVVAACGSGDWRFVEEQWRFIEERDPGRRQK